MAEEQFSPGDSASQLQEAIDSIVRTFDYPGTLSIEYTYDGTTKRTTFEIQSEGDNIVYELQYDGSEEGTEPRLTRHS